MLDLACGTGVVAITAARLGARVTGLDLTPELLAVAQESSRIAAVEIDWHEGDVEKLLFAGSRYEPSVGMMNPDETASSFGHRVVIALVRVLK